MSPGKDPPNLPRILTPLRTRMAWAGSLPHAHAPPKGQPRNPQALRSLEKFGDGDPIGIFSFHRRGDKSRGRGEWHHTQLPPPRRAHQPIFRGVCSPYSSLGPQSGHLCTVGLLRRAQGLGTLPSVPRMFAESSGHTGPSHCFSGEVVLSFYQSSCRREGVILILNFQMGKLRPIELTRPESAGSG